jgi:hypothetical protein
MRVGGDDSMSERDDLTTGIAEATGVQPQKVGDVVRLALEELHRLTIVDEKGPTAAVMEACFSFGGEAAFHLIGLFASEHAYHGQNDSAGMWSEVAMRFIPRAYAEGCDRIAPWFSQRTAARLELEAAIQEHPEQNPMEEKYAEEHKRFLEENNPTVLLELKT